MRRDLAKARAKSQGFARYSELAFDDRWGVGAATTPLSPLGGLPARRVSFLSILILTFAAGCATGGLPPTGTTPRSALPSGQVRAPFFNARSHLSEYAGPGGETPAPDDLEEVRIGWFGPSDPDHPEAGTMWLAALLAIDDANRAGGYNGLPFKLHPAWSENPWGTGVKDVARLVYEQNVWAMIGAPDGPSAHLVEQVVAKARLPFVSPVSTDKTTNLANVPWTFSCAPGDHIQASVLAKALMARATGERFAMVSCTDHDSRVFAIELLAALDDLSVFPARRLEFRPEILEFDSQLDGVRQAEPAVVVLIAGPRDSGRFLIALRGAGLTMPVFGGPAMGRRLFLDIAGEAAEGVVFPLLWHPSSAAGRSAEFGRRFRERFNIEPDYTAAHTYDGMALLIAAIRRAGLNRVRIRDALRMLSPWHGVTGSIRWDPTGHNHRPVALGTIHQGRIRPTQSP